MSTSDRLTIRALGVLYSLEVGVHAARPVDWLDRTLLDVTKERQRIDELVAALHPLPSRLVEDAIWRLFARNELLIDVHEGRVIASALPPTPEAPSWIPIQVWQDQATAMMIPLEKVKGWEEWASNRRSEQQAGLQIGRTTRRVDLPVGPTPRTLMEMSDAEILHRLCRFRPELALASEVRLKHKLRPLNLIVEAAQRADGRLSVVHGIPYQLRAAWSRLPESSVVAEGDLSHAAQTVSWDRAVGRWSQETKERVEGTRATRDRGTDRVTQLINQLDSKGVVEYREDGSRLTKRLAREARMSIVVAISGAQSEPGEAVEILQENPEARRYLLLSTRPRPQKMEQWIARGIQVRIVTDRPLPDFLLADGATLALGGLSPSASRVLVVKSSRLEGYLAWLSELSQPILPEEITGRVSGSDPDHQNPLSLWVAEVGRDLAGLDADIRDLESQIQLLNMDSERGSGRGNVEQVREALRGRCERLERRLLAQHAPPVDWLTPAEIPSLVEELSGPLRIVVRDPSSPLVEIAHNRGVAWTVWPEANAPADCVIAEDTVILGVFLAEKESSGPDFLAVVDPDLASALRREAASHPPRTFALPFPDTPR